MNPRTLQTRALACAGLFALLIAAVLLIRCFFPSAREDDFALNERSLQQVPSGLLVVRPTRFAHFHFHGVVSTAVPVWGKRVPRFLGRNVTFKQVMAAAYGQPVDRVVLPEDAPRTNFDFLVTVRERPKLQFQQAIRKQLGFVARVEPHPAQVLALSVADASLPGLALSDAQAKENIEVKDGNVCFTHVRLGELTGVLESQLQMPVVDKTGLTNAYDFSLACDAELKAAQQVRKGVTARDAFQEILNGWGLVLKPDTTTLQMLVVKRAD